MIDLVVWRGDRRIRVRKAAKTRNKYEALERERAERQKLEVAVSVGGRAPLFADWVVEFLDTYATANNKPSELASKKQICEQHLVPFFGDLRLDDIGEAHIERFKAEQLRSSYKPKTVNNRLGVLRRALQVAHKWKRVGGVLPEIAWLHVPDQPFDFLTAEESERLRAATTPEWLCMVTLGLRCGLRHGELLALAWDDIDLDNGQLTVRRSVWKGELTDPKGKRTRHLPLSPTAVAVLKNQPRRGRWVHSGERLLTRHECRWPLHTTCARAGLRSVGWHVLRHSFASQLVMRGVSLRAVQELMGHRDIKQTMRYAHLSPHVTQSAVSLLDSPHMDRV